MTPQPVPDECRTLRAVLVEVPEMPRRPLTIETSGARLEGELQTPDDSEGPFPCVVICHPHPQYGGSMHNNVVYAVAAGCIQQGIAALLFNFRGAGGSDGEPGDRGEAQADALEVLSFAATLEEVDSERVALAGYSFGAGTAAAVVTGAQPRALALVALPTSMVEDGGEALRSFDGPLLLLSGDRDRGSGEGDLRELLAGREAEAQIEIQPGADHFWGGHERAIAQVTGAFFAGALGEP